MAELHLCCDLALFTIIYIYIFISLAILMGGTPHPHLHFDKEILDDLGGWERVQKCTLQVAWI